MKRITALALSLAMVLSLTACDNSGESGSSGGGSSAVSSDNGETNSGTNNPGGQGSETVRFGDDGNIDMELALSYETDIEAFKKSLEGREVDLSKPVSLNAQNNPKTMAVWNLLKNAYGKQIISAQQQMNLTQTYEDKVYYDVLDGDLPAMKGFDFIFTTTGNTDTTADRGFVDAAIEWGTESSGLVTFCWHWNVPRDVDKPSNGKAFYMERDGVKIENWNARNATVPGTKEYEVAVHDIDLIASYLKELEEAGITVLWRPFHEASGSWFWWGLQSEDKAAFMEGKYDTFQRLWYMMFDRLENYHKLSNIIWVWNGQSAICAVDPNTYDIAGIDYYANKEDHSSCKQSYNSLSKYTYEGKMLALTETGYIPDPQQCMDDGCMWLYFMPWNGGFVYEPVNPNDEGTTPILDFFGTPNPNPKRMPAELLKEYFGNPIIISWNDLTDMPYGEHKTPQNLLTWDILRNPVT